MTKFTARDKATLRDESDRTDNPVTIQSDALRWVDDPAHATHLYLVQHDNIERSQQPFLVLSTLLTPAEQWEPCPGRHRPVGADHRGFAYRVERLVE